MIDDGKWSMVSNIVFHVKTLDDGHYLMVLSFILQLVPLIALSSNLTEYLDSSIFFNFRILLLSFPDFQTFSGVY